MYNTIYHAAIGALMLTLSQKHVTPMLTTSQDSFSLLFFRLNLYMYDHQWPTPVTGISYNVLDLPEV